MNSNIKITISDLKLEKLTLNMFFRLMTYMMNIIFIFCMMAWGGFMLHNLENLTENEMVIESVKYYAPFYISNPTIMFQTVFLFLAVAHDVLEWSDKQHSSLAQKIRYWRDVIFNGLVVPYTCFVFSMFWSLYTIDRELVFPRVYDAVVPWWFNQCVHTNILVMVAVETFLQARRYPTDKKLELILNGTVGVLYAIVYYSIYFFANRWLYNVFGIMTWWQICIFQIGIWTSSYVFYVIYFPINRLIHGEKDETDSNCDTIKNNGNVTHSNGNLAPVNEPVEFKNGFIGKNLTDKLNGIVIPNNENVLENKGNKVKVTKTNGEHKSNEDPEKLFTISHTSSDFNVPPFSTKSWSLKYRNLRNQFENSSL